MAYLSLQLSLQLAPKTNFSLRAINYTQNGAPYQNTKSGGPLILEIPLEKIRRPLSRTRANDPVKVKDLMESIQEIGLQEPIDVLEVDGVYYESTDLKIGDVLKGISKSPVSVHYIVSRVVTGLKLTNGLDLQAYVVKFGVALKKLSGITCVNSNANSNYISN
ncbi:hypothetical protein AMTR_s00062p00193540 [Amborella trichopoda]|uniref:sulfiredoxin n=1 Tax=Amborella trichopoda TaxID=13333 RepID=U5DGZ2_AMBTC|nr:hypothetical protein AMTR_s00062p00193540 [Amborella trichopoda]